jgi:predicted phage terminase large subunit-like protein
MSALERRLLELKLRSDLMTFIHRTFHTIASAQRYQHNWHLEAVAWHLEQCAKGAIKRLVVTLPPRSLKSICASVAYPAWVLGHDPTARIICASYSENLAAKHSLDCRAVMESDWYRRLFPHTRISREKNTELNFLTTRQGYRYATSVGGTLTGRGGNLIIIDDPIKPDDALSEAKRSAVNEWFDRTLYSRLDDKRNDTIVLIMQRLHVEDLAGYVTQKELWAQLGLPAVAEVEQTVALGPDENYTRKVGEVLHEAREPKEVLDQLKVTLGSFNFSAQYQQCPIPLEGEIIHWEWFRFYDELPRRVAGDRIVQSWDTASKAEEISDYSVGTTWLIQGNDYYLLDVLRKRLTYPDLKRRIIDHACRFSVNEIVIEDKGSGTALIQDLGSENITGVPYPIAFMPETDKVTRMHAQSAKVEAGHVYLPLRAEWLEDFRTELLQFPKGRYDDQVDSLSQFLNWVEQRNGSRFSVEPLEL